MVDDNFKLPQKAYVNKFVAKTKFYKKANLNSKLEKEFIDKVQRITWKYKLAESTIGIAKTDIVEEIQIFEIELKEQVTPKKVLQVIDKSIRFQILYRFVYKDNIAYGITLKDNSNVDYYYFSHWNEVMNFDFTGINLEKVYQKLIKAFIRDEVKDKNSFNEIIDIDKKIKALETEIITLENKISKEKQFNRKIDINKILLTKKAEIKLLKDK